MYGWSEEIVRTAVESVPEEILENEKVVEALEYLASWIDQYSDYIEPHGDEYEEIVARSERDGAYKVIEVLRDAQYRYTMFGTEVDLASIIEEVENGAVLL